MRVFLTGGTGFLGGVLAAQLAASGHEVRALVRDAARGGALAATGATLRTGDVTDGRAVLEGMRGCDAVAHCAGWYRHGVCDGREAQRVNVDGTRHVLAAMRELGVARGVYTSTIAVNSDTHGALVDEDHRFRGRYLSVYEATKADAHALAEQAAAEGLPLVILQPGAIYGPGDHSDLMQAARAALRGRLPVVPRGTAYAWAHVEDVARGHLLALERGTPGRNYFLTGPAVALTHAFALAAAAGGVRAPRELPAGLLRAAAPVMAVLDKCFPIPAVYTGEALRVAAGVTYLGSAERARRELGWQARPFEPAWRALLADEARALRTGRPPAV
jgi:nucleoside-diphosphate-sugar epimerase